MFKRSATVWVIVLISGLLVFFAIPCAQSADFPKKPVKIITTAAAGGGEDTEARGIAPYLEKHLGVNIMVENQPGAGGKIAFEKFQRTEPDGYSLITYTFPKSIIIEYMDKVNYRTRDYTSIFAWSRSNQLLVGHADTWKTFDEFLKAAKAKTLAGGLSGRGSTTHLAGLVAVDELGIKVNWVPYEGAAGSVAALAGKHLDFTICLATSALPLIQAGKLRPLLMFSDKRDPYFPDVPIPKDLGFDITSLPAIRGVQAPPNTPASIVKVLEEACSKAIKDPAFVEFAKNRKMVIHPLQAQEFGKIVVEAYPKVEKFKEMFKE
ncbi:MAG: tripartite tricarboxylate transporter substrate binding protein [Thermodesulfobacteriota bacterium]|nr:tripartite tricarboxylate transporter substrate binding protein [Thermodesulfobacteriota bacterium]